MIVFDLKCISEGHVFEAWFGSSDDYEDQRGRGLVQCPFCESADVDKAVMAPRVGAKGNRNIVPAAHQAEIGPSEMKEIMAAMATLQKKVLANSDYVGDRFADEARAIYLGEAEARSIYGKATREQTESLLEEGIEVSPLPFPIPEPGSEN